MPDSSVLTFLLPTCSLQMPLAKTESLLLEFYMTELYILSKQWLNYINEIKSQKTFHYSIYIPLQTTQQHKIHPASSRPNQLSHSIHTFQNETCIFKSYGHRVPDQTLTYYLCIAISHYLTYSNSKHNTQCIQSFQTSQ